MDIIKKLRFVSIILLLLFILPFAAAADTPAADVPASEFSVAPVFGDNMIFQQNEPIKIWGTSPCEGEYITVMFDGSLAKAYVTDGKWEATLAERSYSNDPKVLEIYGNEDSEYVSFENIRIGDVWWVMGQSNAEFSTCADPYWAEFNASLTGNENVTLLDLNSDPFSPKSHTRWRKLNTYSAQDASALACFTATFASNLINNEIPFAMVTMAYKGHEISSFMPKSMAKKHTSNGTSSEIYDSVIDHVLPMPVKGIIWYQGEADSNIYFDYSKKLSEYITWLRDEKDQTNHDFPIYCIELSPSFNDPNDPDRQYIDYGNVRGEAGVLSSQLKNFNICVTSDLWADRKYSNNLHPNNKSSVSMRLSYMLLAREYGFGNEDYYFGPTLKTAKLSADKRVATLTFDHCGEGLSAAKFDGFLPIGRNWNPVDAKYEITAPNQITVTSDQEICILKYNIGTSNVFDEDIFIKNSNNIPAAAFSFTFISPDAYRAHLKYIVRAMVAGAVLVVILLIIFIVRKYRKKHSA